MATYVVEVLVGKQNVSLRMEDHGGGAASLDLQPLRELIGPKATDIGTAILSNQLMGEVVHRGETVGWIAWDASYVEGSAIAEDLNPTNLLEA